MSIQQGPGEILVAMKLKFKSGIDSDKLCDVINNFERQLEARVPEVKWSFVEPDNRD